MLRAALIGFPSSGKSTLFQLMTSARDGAGGKGDVRIGISKVPDDRLDVLTGMYNPKKRVPATVEFTDIAVVAKARNAVRLLERKKRRGLAGGLNAVGPVLAYWALNRIRFDRLFEQLLQCRCATVRGQVVINAHLRGLSVLSRRPIRDPDATDNGAAIGEHLGEP